MTDIQNESGITGCVVVELHDANGVLKARYETHNIVTAVGDQYYAGRAVLASALPAQVTGMKLGTGSTSGGNAPAKTGAGAALTTYLADSNKALDSGFPTAVAGVATFKRTYAPGEATTSSAITEVVLVTDTIGTTPGATSTAANTIARAPITGVAAKQSTDTLTVTWTHTLLGA